VYISTGSIWTEQAKLTASNGVVVGQFGWSIAISGDTIVIGAASNDDNRQWLNKYLNSPFIDPTWLGAYAKFLALILLWST